MLAGQVASGDINPSRFVTKSGAYTVAQAVAGGVAIGISQEGTHDTPIPGASGLAAAENDPIRVYSEEDDCLLDAGAAVADAAFLKSDADGKGITAASGERYYAIAERGASAADEKMQVHIVFGIVP